MLIHLEKLGKSFGEKVVLHDVSASVEKEDRIGIVGQNGVTEEQMAKCIAKECACTSRCKCSGNLPDQSDDEAYEMTLE